MRWVADAVYLIAGLVYLPVALYHALLVGKNRRGWRQRFGSIPTYDPAQQRIWIHAVSLGELNATPGLVAALRQRHPEADIVVSTTTDTGYARAVQLYGKDRVFRFPLDFSLVVGRVLRHVRPSLIVLVELEVWYNLVRMAKRRGIPVVVVNGRLTERSASRLRCLGRFSRSMFADLAGVGAQDETIAARFRELGVPGERIEITSSLKWDTATVADDVEGTNELAAALGLDRSQPIWVCGSTGDGEEEMILDAYQMLRRSDEATKPRSDEERHEGTKTRRHEQLPTLVIVPRKPERFDEVARLIESRGYTCIRRSRCPDKLKTASPLCKGGLRGVILGDTMGELRKFYCLADVVFVGRSLVPMGGSDPMEAAALGKPVIVGPHMENFDAPVRALRAANALRVIESAEQLTDVARALFADEAAAKALGARAREVVLQNQGATARTAERLAQLLAGR